MSLSKESKTVSRRQFIARWMRECNVTYDTACRLYRSMVTTFEEGIANAEKITIGRLGALIPHRQNSRTAVMGFRRVQGGIVHHKQEYYLDPRVRFKFKLYKEWLNKSRLNW